jgi:drug/metabolite transporter (DMT)-like permease
MAQTSALPQSEFGDTPPAQSRPQVPLRVFLALLAGILAISMAGVFVKLAQADGVPSLAIAAGRLTLAALILTPFTLIKHRAALMRLSRSDLLFAALSGLFLGLHFALWIASLEYTSVLISVVFVSTGPLWVALLEFLFLKAKLGAVILAGLALAVVGGVNIGLSTSAESAGSNPLLGAGLALGGAIAVAIYLVIGRKLRAKLDLLPYIWLVYGSAALFLLLAVFVTATPLETASPGGWFWVVMLALFPQLVGHTSFNYALRYLSATYVSIATQLEPVGSAIVAFILLGETATFTQVWNSIAILIGVSFATYGQNQRDSSARRES